MIGTETINYNRSNKYEGDLYYGNQKPNKTKQKGKYPTKFLGTFTRILQKNSPKSIDDKIKY